MRVIQVFDSFKWQEFELIGYIILNDSGRVTGQDIGRGGVSSYLSIPINIDAKGINVRFTSWDDPLHWFNLVPYRLNGSYRYLEEVDPSTLTVPPNNESG